MAQPDRLLIRTVYWCLALHGGPQQGVESRQEARAAADGHPGQAVQVDPIKPTLKPPGTKRLKLKCDELRSSFGFKFNVRRYALGAGNHYAEIQVVDEIFDKHAADKMGIERVGQVMVMIHSGSRGLGHQAGRCRLTLSHPR